MTPARKTTSGRTPRTVLMGRRFMEQAEADLTFARRNLGIGGYYVAANLAHQAAEKALKAAHWHLRAEEPPWEHRLADVAGRISERVRELPNAVESAIGQLEPMFEQSRDPSGRVDDPIPARLVQEGDARMAIGAAEEVMAWVRDLLQRPPGRAQRQRRS